MTEKMALATRAAEFSDLLGRYEVMDKGRASCANIWQASLGGSMASAIQVGRFGNMPVRVSEVLGELNR